MTIENPLPPIKAYEHPCWASLSSSRAGRYLWTRKKLTDPSGLFKRLINPHRGSRGGRGFRALCEPPLSWSLNLPKYQALSSMIQSSSLFPPSFLRTVPRTERIGLLRLGSGTVEIFHPVDSRPTNRMPRSHLRPEYAGSGCCLIRFKRRTTSRINGISHRLSPTIATHRASSIRESLICFVPQACLASPHTSRGEWKSRTHNTYAHTNDIPSDWNLAS